MSVKDMEGNVARVFIYTHIYTCIILLSIFILQMYFFKIKEKINQIEKGGNIINASGIENNGFIISPRKRRGSGR